METPSLENKEISRILRFMSRHDSMRKAAEALLARDYMRLGSANLYIGTLESHITGDMRVCLLSAEALKFLNLAPAQRERAEDSLIDIVEARYYPRMIQGLMRLFMITLILFASFMLVLLVITVGAAIIGISLQTFSSLISWTVIAMIVGAIIILFVVVPLWSFIVNRRTFLRLRQVSAETLGRWGGPASIDALVSTCDNAALWPAASPSLRRVLQRLGPRDFGRVKSSSARGLAVLFNPQFNSHGMEAWTPAVLDALAVVGDGECVELVENVVNSGSKPEWRSQATDVLQILIERQRFERDSTQLLRATASNESRNSLLRPVSAAEKSEENLLRATLDKDTLL